MYRVDGTVLKDDDLDPIWKRNVVVFGVSKGHFTEADGTDPGSKTYTATAVGYVTCEWEGGKKEQDRDLPIGTVVTYWPDTGKVRIDRP